MSSTVGRLVATASDMDASGLAAIGYYLRLYAVELMLGESREQRSEEQTQLATELLNQVEEYRNAVDASKDQDHGAFTVLHDQGKAKMYVLNFSMSLYNEKLTQLRNGNWDANLRRGLWCCLDLFQCLAKLWGMHDELKERVKYCKIYLRKIAREKPPTPQVDEKELDDMLERLNTETNEEQQQFKAESSPPEFIDESALDKPEQPIQEEDATKEPQALVKGPVVDEAPATPDESCSPPKEATARTTPDLRTMMNRSMLFEQTQKKAKYAISALNYEDTNTAKQELTSALSLLQELEK